MKTIRYVLPKEIKQLFEADRKTKIPLVFSESPRLVNILEDTEDMMKVSVYFANGEVVTGWMGKILYPPLELLNQDELYDGRFNA
jgi:hypothetical protein